jgi:hypothetical protein
MRASYFWNSRAAEGLFDPCKPSSFQREPLQDRIVAQVVALHAAGVTVTAQAVLARYWPRGEGLGRIEAELDAAVVEGLLIEVPSTNFAVAPIVTFQPRGA